MANENGARLRFRPAGSAARQHGAPEYGPLGTGCPAVEQAVTALYKAQNEESFWTLMNALNYALELDMTVLALGHYASETTGPRALMERIGREFGIETLFAELPTGL